jgi:hypothetical protein
MAAFIGSVWELTPDLKIHSEAVHRISDLGAVVTHVAHGLTSEGFDAEWRMIAIFTVDGDLISRYEMFDEADLDAALARFDDLSRPTRQPENTTTQVFEHFQAYFAARDWDALAGILAEDMCNDDRRRVVGAGKLLGRDTDIAHMRAIADVGAKTIAATVLATRGERLALSRILFYGEDQRPEAFQAELLGLVEIDLDDRIVARLSFDPDDIDAAFAELDARYRDGEAATHAHTWSVVAGAFSTLNTRQIPETTPGCVNIDHRRGIASEANIIAFADATWDVAPDLVMRIEAVHRLTDLGALVTWVTHGTAQTGFEAEWRALDILTVDGNLISHAEIFDETDLEAAFARFDELSKPTPD